MATEPVVLSIDPEVLARLKHPEWVVMYLNGVTPEQIAKRVYYTPNEVRSYLSSFRLRRPDWYARRLLLHDRPRPRPANVVDRDRDWKRRVHEVMAFQLRHGRRPLHASGNAHEMRLGEWITGQRSDDRLGKLPGHRRRWMDESVPDWRIPDRDLAGAVKWREQLGQVREHRERTGTWPKVWRSPDAERQLANWLLTQRARARKRRLSVERAEALDDVLPGWRRESLSQP